MKIEQLERKPEREAFLSQHKRLHERQASEGIMHERQDYSREKPMEGFREGPRSVREGGMREIFRVENSYSSISLGINKKKEKALVVRRKHNQNGPTVSRNQKELDEDMSYRYVGRGGDNKLNRYSPVSSAFVLKNYSRGEAENHWMGHFLMRESERFGKMTGQHQLESILPEKTGDNYEGQEYSEYQKIAERMDMALRREWGKTDPDKWDDRENGLLKRVADSFIGSDEDETDDISDEDAIEDEDAVDDEITEE